LLFSSAQIYRSGRAIDKTIINTSAVGHRKFQIPEIPLCGIAMPTLRQNLLFLPLLKLKSKAQNEIQ